MVVSAFAMTSVGKPSRSSTLIAFYECRHRCVDGSRRTLPRMGLPGNGRDQSEIPVGVVVQHRASSPRSAHARQWHPIRRSLPEPLHRVGAAEGFIKYKYPGLTSRRTIDEVANHLNLREVTALAGFDRLLTSDQGHDNRMRNGGLVREANAQCVAEDNVHGHHLYEGSLSCHVGSGHQRRAVHKLDRVRYGRLQQGVVAILYRYHGVT